MGFMDMGKKQKIIFAIECIAIILFLFTVGSAIVVSPILGDVDMIDEGQLGAWIAHMGRGAHIYKDFYAAYGPFYIYPLFLLSKFFSPSVFIIRIFYMVISTFLAVLISRLIIHKLKIPHFLWIFAMILLVVIPGFGIRQGIGLLCILMAYLAMEKRNYFYSIASGLLLPGSFLVSSEIGIFSTVICSIFFIYNLLVTENITTVVKKLFIIIASSACLLIIFFVWANSQGWFYPYVNSIITDLTIYSSIALPIGQNFPNALALMPHSFSIISWIKYIVSQQMLLYWLIFFYIVTFFYFIIRIILRKTEKNETLIFLVAIYGLFLSEILIGRSGHFNFTLPPVFILFAYYLNILIQSFKLSKKTSERYAALFVITIIIFFSVRILSIYRPHFSRILLLPKAITSQKNNPKFVGSIFISPGQAKMIRTMKDFIDKNTKENDKVFFFSNSAMMYLLVQRENPTLYDLPEVANTVEKRREVLNSLKKDRTKYIIYDTLAYSVDGVSNRMRLPEVFDYIKKNYSKTKLKNFIIYTRNK